MLLECIVIESHRAQLAQAGRKENRRSKFHAHIVWRTYTMVRRSFFVFAVFSSLWWSSSAATVVVTGASKLDLPANVLPEDGAVLTRKVSVDGFVQCGGKIYQSGGSIKHFVFVRPSLWRLHSFSCSGQEVLLASQKPKVLLGICKCLWPPASLLQLWLTPSQRTAIRLTRGLPGRRKIHWLRLFQKLMQAFGKVDIALADLSRVQPFFSLTTQKQGQRSKKKRQGRSLSTDRIFSSWKFHWRGTMSSLGIRRLVFQFNWRVFWFSLQMQYCVVLFQNNGLDGISSLGSCPPSDARCSGSWLHTINWVKKGDQMVPKICVVFWSYARILSLQ